MSGQGLRSYSVVALLKPHAPPDRQGDRFVIENSKGVLIRRSKEGRKGAATAMDMVQELSLIHI